MNGQPVWLVSVSMRRQAKNDSKIIPTGEWSKTQFRAAKELAHNVLKGIGERQRERAFRMNVTFCIHRALSELEVANLDPSFNKAPGGLAGGPVEVLWSKGIEHCTASMPCENPAKRVIVADQPELWVPIDCEQCDPCLARKKIEDSIVLPLRERTHETPAIDTSVPLRDRMRRRRKRPGTKRSR